MPNADLAVDGDEGAKVADQDAGAAHRFGPVNEDDRPSVVFLPDGATHIIDLTIPLPSSISAAAATMIRMRNALPDPTN